MVGDLACNAAGPLVVGRILPCSRVGSAGRARLPDPGPRAISRGHPWSGQVLARLQAFSMAAQPASEPARRASAAGGSVAGAGRRGCAHRPASHSSAATSRSIAAAGRCARTPPTRSRTDAGDGRRPHAVASARTGDGSGRPAWGQPAWGQAAHTRRCREGGRCRGRRAAVFARVPSSPAGRDLPVPPGQPPGPRSRPRSRTIAMGSEANQPTRTSQPGSRALQGRRLRPAD